MFVYLCTRMSCIVSPIKDINLVQVFVFAGSKSVHYVHCTKNVFVALLLTN